MNLSRRNKEDKLFRFKKVTDGDNSVNNIRTFCHKSLKKVCQLIINNQFYRFILVGIFNTVGGYIIYCLFLNFLNYLISYLLSVSIFICLTSYLNTSFVFRVKTKIVSILFFGLSSLIQILLGVILINFSVQKLLVPEVFAPLINILFITPLIYLLNIVLSIFLRKDKKYKDYKI